MTSKNLEAYISNNWGPPQKTISEISASNNSEPLVRSEKKMYCLDDICKDIYVPKYLPTSADGLDFRPRCIHLIEFKSGFRDKITKENFDLDTAKCESKGDLCQDYWKSFRRVRELEKEALVDSLRLKAIESYITLDRCLLPLCEELPGKQVRIKLTAVIDAEESDTMEDMLAELAGKKPKSDNPYKNIRQALSRLQQQTDKKGITYYYDEIEVISAQEYQKRISE